MVSGGYNCTVCYSYFCLINKFVLFYLLKVVEIVFLKCGTAIFIGFRRVAATQFFITLTPLLF